MSEDGTMMRMPCDERNYYPTVSLQVQNYWMEMLPEDYLVEEGGSCVLGFLENEGSEYWLLGDSFFRGYYVIHDDEQGRLGVVPHATSTK
jgi:hypothetical protein